MAKDLKEVKIASHSSVDDINELEDNPIWNQYISVNKGSMQEIYQKIHVYP